jgi:hypothetical protein
LRRRETVSEHGTATVQEVLDAPAIDTLESYDAGAVLADLFQSLDGAPCLECIRWSDHAEALRPFSVLLKARRRYDFRRSSSVYVVCYEGEPVAVASCYGREEDDAQFFYWLDRDRAKRALGLLAAIAADGAPPELAAPDDEVRIGNWGDRAPKLGESLWSRD